MDLHKPVAILGDVHYREVDRPHGRIEQMHALAEHHRQHRHREIVEQAGRESRAHHRASVDVDVLSRRRDQGIGDKLRDLALDGGDSCPGVRQRAGGRDPHGDIAVRPRPVKARHDVVRATAHEQATNACEEVLEAEPSRLPRRPSVGRNRKSRGARRAQPIQVVFRAGDEPVDGGGQVGNGARRGRGRWRGQGRCCGHEPTVRRGRDAALGVLCGDLSTYYDYLVESSAALFDDPEAAARRNVDLLLEMPRYSRKTGDGGILEYAGGCVGQARDALPSLVAIPTDGSDAFYATYTVAEDTPLLVQARAAFDQCVDGLGISMAVDPAVMEAIEGLDWDLVDAACNECQAPYMRVFERLREFARDQFSGDYEPFSSRRARSRTTSSMPRQTRIRGFRPLSTCSKAGQRARRRPAFCFHAFGRRLASLDVSGW